MQEGLLHLYGHSRRATCAMRGFWHMSDTCQLCQSTSRGALVMAHIVQAKQTVQVMKQGPSAPVP